MRPERRHRRAPPERRGRRALRAALTTAGVAVALVAAGCTGGSGGDTTAPTPSAPLFVPQGRLVLDLGGFDQRLVEYRLPTDTLHELAGRASAGPFLGQRYGAAFGPDGFVYTLGSVNFGLVPDVQLYRVRAGSRPQEVGGIVRGGSGFAFGGDVAVTWTCARRAGQVLVLDVTARRPAWTAVAAGCDAGVSPDGRTVAYVDRHSVWTIPAAGGTPTRLLDLGSVEGLPGRRVEHIRPNLAGMAFGDGGVAVTLGSQLGGWAIVVVRPGRRPQVVLLGTNEPRGTAWQPGGRLLAFGDFVAQSETSEVRVFDPGTGALTQVSASLNFGQFVWSPDGRVLAVSRNASVLAFIDPAAGQVGTAPIPGDPDDWAR